MQVRAATEADFPRILELNAESVHFLSPLTPSRLHALHAQAAWHAVVDDGTAVAAFLLALREGSDYDSPNYRWFAERYPRFLYVDRVVVAVAAQGRGFGRALYDALFKFARAAGVPCVTCEFDIEPPNEASRRFHAGYGFREVGVQVVGALRKQVSLQRAELRADQATALQHRA